MCRSFSIFLMFTWECVPVDRIGYQALISQSAHHNQFNLRENKKEGISKANVKQYKQFVIGG